MFVCILYYDDTKISYNLKTYCVFIKIMSRSRCRNISVEYAQQNYPSSNYDNSIVIFLAGPTPQYGGSDPAHYSWRDRMISDIDACLDDIVIDNNICAIVPEPESRNWKSTKYGMTDEQITWEYLWLERSNIIIFWHETRWKPNSYTLKNCYHGKDIANIGIQFRFEVGLYIQNINKIRIFYIPSHAEGITGVLWWLSHKKDKKLSGYSNYELVLLETIDSIKLLI